MSDQLVEIVLKSDFEVFKEKILNGVGTDYTNCVEIMNNAFGSSYTNGFPIVLVNSLSNMYEQAIVSLIKENKIESSSGGSKNSVFLKRYKVTARV